MTVTLVIDTSTSRTTVAVLEEAELLWQASHDGAMEHAKALSNLISQALKIPSRIDRVVIGMGPGPYTGLRVGIAFARTFALARSIELIGVCSLDAIVSGAGSYIIATDARRKEIYWARYQDGVRIDGPSVRSPKDVEISDTERAYGEGAFKYGLTTSDDSLYPEALNLYTLSLTQNFTEPFYLRRPDAVPTVERG